MAISIEEAKAFIQDAEKSQANWLTMAERSWQEIKKRQRNDKIWSVTPNSVRRRNRYPAWYSVFKIRQPLVLSRAGIPIGRDTTQDGKDNVGATAAICLERLAVNLRKTYDFFDMLCCARDDFLATNFAEVRGYYERKEVKERVKEYLVPQQGEDPDNPDEVVFFDSKGRAVTEAEIKQDDQGFFIELNQVVDVEDERVYLEPVLYRDIRVDPDIRRWPRCKRLAFKCKYSRREFEDVFGREALATLPAPEKINVGDDEASPKLQLISVWEYWDYYEKETYWFADQGSDFIKPQNYKEVEYDEDVKTTCCGIYDLDGFFPVPPPLIMNAPTDEFWPIPEYYQLVEIIDDIHMIFARMMALTRCIRARLLFDNNVDGLQEALNEASEGDAFGVPNLASSLMAAGGSLENVVQYIPVEQMVAALNNMYQALEQRLNTFYRLTGTSDMLQGLAQDQTQRTFGERQMTERYALNQLEEPQRKMQQFVRDCDQLQCEMALKLFNDRSLEKYIIPQTLDPIHQQNYKSAIELLRSDPKRFRIELETDSTIAINEEYDKQMRIELVNTLTQAIEKTAATAINSPALVKIELHAMKFLIQGFRQGKMFQQEITEAIDNVIKQAEAAAQNAQPAFNAEEVAAQQRAQELSVNSQLKQFEITTQAQTKQYEIQVGAQLESAKLAQNERIAQLKTQLDNYKLMLEQGSKQSDLQFKYDELGAKINEAMQDIAQRREEMFVELQKVSSEAEAKALKLQIDAQFAAAETQLAETQTALQASQHQLDLEERWATEHRLQQEAQLAQLEMDIKAAEVAHEITKPPEVSAPEITIEAPPPVARKKRVRVKRDKAGNLRDFESRDEETPIKKEQKGE